MCIYIYIYIYILYCIRTTNGFATRFHWTVCKIAWSRATRKYIPHGCGQGTLIYQFNYWICRHRPIVYLAEYMPPMIPLWEELTGQVGTTIAQWSWNIGGYPSIKQRTSAYERIVWIQWNLGPPKKNISREIQMFKFVFLAYTTTIESYRCLILFGQWSSGHHCSIRFAPDTRNTPLSPAICWWKSTSPRSDCQWPAPRFF